MAAPLLSTKFFIPPARTDAVERQRLTAKLSMAVNRPGCFTLLSGPAGAGKTTLLSGFAARLQQKIAWVSLDEADNDPNRFWTCIITACKTIMNGVGEQAFTLLHAPQTLPEDTIPTLLINDLAAHDQSVIVVLDDYHLIQNAYIHSSLLFLLEHQPGNLHIIVSTRTDPPWPLARFRARNQLSEIRAQDLRFNPQETAEFLNHAAGLHLSPGNIAALEERTEGWAAGLQLAALSLQDCADVDSFIHAFAGSHIYIAEYLLEEILKHQTEETQAFLLQTAILERMNGALCEAVTQCPDGEARLKALHRANVFVIPLDNEGRWFRYHHLFADLLRMRLSQMMPANMIANLHARAAGWYERNGYLNEAISHAFAAQDFERAAALVDQAAEAMLYTGQFNLLKTWLEALPTESFLVHPRLEIFRILIDLSQGTLDMSEQTLLETEKIVRALPPSPENDRLQLEALVLLCLFLAHQNTARAIQIAQETLDKLPKENQRLRAYLFSALYRGYGMEGDIEKADFAYRESLRFALADGQYIIAANTTMVRAFDLAQYARLQEAARYCQAIIDLGVPSGANVFYPAGPAYIGLAGVCLERNELEMAAEYLERGMELCRQAGLDGLYTGSIQKARLHQARGDFDAALEEIRLLEQAYQRKDFTLLTRQVSVQLARRDTEGVLQMAQSLMAIQKEGPSARQMPLIAAEALKLLLARILLAQGAAGQALEVLDEIQSTAETGKRFGRLIEVHLLRALALQKQHAGQMIPQAVQSIQRAVELAEPEGIALVFLEEGSDLLPLLVAVENSIAAPARIKKYAGKLVRAFSRGAVPVTPPPASTATELVEPLTAREMDVLQCIARGDSNQDIANSLFITVRTVKKHAGNIFLKLNVNSRTQAAARAREIGLLPRE